MVPGPDTREAPVNLLFVALLLVSMASPRSTEQVASTPLPLEVTVEVQTSAGDFTIVLDYSAAPICVASICDLVSAGYYDGAFIHRVIANFGIQFGCSFTKSLTTCDLWGRGGATPHSTFTSRSGDNIQRDRSGNTPLETNSLSNVARSITVPRSTSAPSLVSSHLFVNLVDNLFLDGNDEQSGVSQHVVIGRVVDGWPVLKKMEVVDVNDLYQPLQPIHIRRVHIFGTSSSRDPQPSTNVHS